MKKSKGLVRNRYQRLQEFKNQKIRKEHRFKNIGKEQANEALKENEQYSSSLLSTTFSNPDIDSASPLRNKYDSIKSKICRVEEIKQQIQNLSKSRLKSFKQEVTKELDRKIGILATEATSNIILAERQFQQLRIIDPKNQQEAKFLNNIQRSLGSEIREATKNLRKQQKQYFNKIKRYEQGSHNKQIQLTETQKNKMKDWQDDQIMQQIDKERDQQINKLVTSINGLTRVYKQMADLVLQQGTLIDRIDYNIQKAMGHTEKGVQHLRNAQKRQQSGFANRCIRILIVVIVVLAIILGFKYSK